MKEIEAAKFKEQCLTLLDRLDTDGLIVTKHGKPVARVVPYDTQDADLIGSLRHKVKVKGDVFTTLPLLQPRPQILLRPVPLDAVARTLNSYPLESLGPRMSG